MKTLQIVAEQRPKEMTNANTQVKSTSMAAVSASNGTHEDGESSNLQLMAATGKPDFTGELVESGLTKPQGLPAHPPAVADDTADPWLL